MVEGFKPKDRFNVADLTHIIRLLRGPGGCPWDAEQTHQTIKKNLIEETYEVIEAINKNDKALLCEELGDLLMQIVFHSEMESETGSFSFDDVADGVCKKLIERHPHVFGSVEVSSVAEVLDNWDAIKRKSKGHDSTGQAMANVPRELPALMRSAKIQSKASSLGFDWPDVGGATDKLREEISEFERALDEGNSVSIFEEFGDILFSAVNISRFAGIDPEEALTAAADKFLKRFLTVERLAGERQINMETAGLAALDELWDEAKHLNE